MIKFVSVEPAEPFDLKEQAKKDFEAYTNRMKARMTDPKTDLHEAEEQDFEEMKTDPEKFNADLK